MSRDLKQSVEKGMRWVAASRRRIASAAVGAVLCLIGYHVVFGANGFIAYQQKRAESRKLEREIRELQEQSARTQERIKSLKSDPHAIEKEARERLRYARPGEMVYKLPSPTAAPTRR